MIEITRALARRLSAVIRHSIHKPYYAHSPLVEFHTNDAGLCVRAVQNEVAVEYRQPGAFRPATVTLPLDALAAVEGRDDGAVILEAGGDGQTVARWEDGGVPQVMAFPLPENAKRPAFPESPGQFVRNSATLLAALAEAVRSTADDETRYAMHRIQLRGKTGEVVGTDSKQLYIHGGFTFAWTDDILVSRVGAFARPELGPVEAVEVGKTDKHVVFGLGPWSLYLGIDEVGRFPPVDLVVPRPSAATVDCQFGPEDAAFLLRALNRLPGKADYNRPVTLDLNGRVCIRARAADQPQAAELVLSRTTYTGPAGRLNLNRDNLVRALQLGFTNLLVVKPDKPVFCRDDQRTFLMMPLDPKESLPPDDASLRVESGGVEESRKVQKPKPGKTPMSTALSNGVEPTSTPVRHRTTIGPTPKNRIGLTGLIGDAQTLKEAARDTLGRAGRLLVALKRHRQQSRLVATTLASLKQLQTIDG